jgi:riboflavin kinase / FMN adenylyltransferase
MGAVPDAVTPEPGSAGRRAGEGDLQVWRGTDALPEGAGPSVVTVGVFDGVHRGHRLVVGRAADVAREHGVPCIVVTFDPHPAEVVGRAADIPRLCSLDHRVALLGDAGADAVWVVDFTREMSQRTPEDFVALLATRLRPVAVVVGGDFRFGHKAAGDVGTLRRLGPDHGFETVAVAPTERAGDRPWSSSGVRALLEAGDVEGAADVLGRPYRVEGVVVHGDHRGRDLGYPTANLATDPRTALPADGVYAGWLVRSSGERLPAAVSIGTNPTFDGVARRAEAYVLDRDDLDLYGEAVAVEVVRRLRGMERFDSVDELTAQMADDVVATRSVLG